eukprot:3002666-Prymnesium_polylepis.1
MRWRPAGRARAGSGAAVRRGRRRVVKGRLGVVGERAVQHRLVERALHLRALLLQLQRLRPTVVWRRRSAARP